jgi:hypothetical protein
LFDFHNSPVKPQLSNKVKKKTLSGNRFVVSNFAVQMWRTWIEATRVNVLIVGEMGPKQLTQYEIEE